MDEDLSTTPALEGTPPEHSAVEPEPVWSRAEPVALRRIDVLVLLMILLASGVTMFARLGEPGKLLPTDAEQCRKFPPLQQACYELIPLDEVHYVPDARDVVRYGTESDTRIGSDDGAFVVHPPVGKWFIAAGIKLFGDRPFGWRFFGAVMGTLSVLVMYMLALRLWRSPWWAALAALLLAADGLWFVLSRIAMLDIYGAAFTLIGVWLLVEDRDRTAPDHRGRRWWRIGAATSFGFAIASKWQVAAFIAVAVAFSLGWDRARGRTYAAPKSKRRALASAGTFALLPAVIYVSTFTPWFVDSQRYNPPRCVDKNGLASQYICYHREMLDFHKHLQKYDKGKPFHPYYGNGYSWPWIGRPVSHFYETTGGGTPNERRMEVLGLPNPFLWWPAFFAGFPLLAWWALRRRDAVARLLFGLFCAGFLPYVAFDVIRRPVFMFYATPLIPVLVLTVVHCLVRAVARWPRAARLVPMYALIVVAAFAFFYPILTAWPLSSSGLLGWQSRIWFGGRWLVGGCTVVDKIKLFCWV